MPAMDGLVAAAIHDVKNSLGQLTVWLEQLRHSPQLQADPPVALCQAELLGQRLNAQLVELLAFYRAGQGALQLQIADHDLRNFLDDLTAELACSSGPQIALQVRLIEDLTVWAFDAYLLKFAVLDALRNAQRHAHTQVALRIQRNVDAGICLEVSDDGPGFSGDLLKMAAEGMEPSATQMQITGSGLGLSFARLIASRHKTPDGRQGQLLLDNQGLPGRRSGDAADRDQANEPRLRGARWRLCLP